MIDGLVHVTQAQHSHQDTVLGHGNAPEAIAHHDGGRPQHMHVRGDGDGVAGHQVRHRETEHLRVTPHLHVEIDVTQALLHQTFEGGKEAMQQILLGDEANQGPILFGDRQAVIAV